MVNLLLRGARGDAGIPGALRPGHAPSRSRCASSGCRRSCRRASTTRASSRATPRTSPGSSPTARRRPAFLAEFDEPGQPAEPSTHGALGRGRSRSTGRRGRADAAGERRRARCCCSPCRRARGRSRLAETPPPERSSRSRPSRRRRPTRRRSRATAAGGAAAATPARSSRRPPGTLPHYDKGFVLVSLAGRRRDAVPARAQPRLAVQVHEQHGDEPDVHGPPRRRARRPAAQRHPAGARRLLLLRLRLRSAARLQHPDLHLERDPGRRRRPATSGFVFSKAFALRAGYFSLPSTRSMTGTYPFFHGHRPEHGHQLLRPGFTQGIWAKASRSPASTTSR